MYSASNTGVRFSNVTSSFEIAGDHAYKAFKAIAPLLDGSYTREDLARVLGGPMWAKVEAFVEPLVSRGFVREMDPCPDVEVSDEEQSRFAEQLSFIAQFVDDPKRRFARFRDSEIAVVAGGAFGEWVGHVLARNGHRRLVVVDDPLVELTKSASRPAVLVIPPTPAGVKLLADGRLGDLAQLVLAASAVGDDIVIGPLSAAGTSPVTWADAISAMAEHDSARDVAHYWASAWAGVHTGSPATTLPAVQRLAGTFAAIDIFRALTGIAESETADSVLVVDSAHGEARRHRVVPHRQLHRSRPTLPPAGRGVGALRRSAPTTARVSPEWGRVCSTVADSLTSPIVGFEDGDLEQLPVKVSIARLALGTAGSVAVGAADLWDVAGARARATRQALALRLETWAPWEESDGLFRGPDVVSELDGMIESNARSVGPLVQGRDLITDDLVWAPAAALATMSLANASGVFARSALGIGVGLDYDEALERAISSAASRRAVSTLERPSLPVIDLADESPEGVFLRESAKHAGVEIEVLRAGRHLQRDVVVARCRSGNTALWELGTGPSEHEAWASAVVGVLGAVRRAQAGKPHSTWTMTALPAFDAMALVAGVPQDNPGDEARAFAFDITTDEVSALGVVAVKVLTAAGEAVR
jgi:CBS domain-containing protein